MTNTLILCGGRGSRLSPLTDECPKPLLQLGKVPILTHIIRALSDRDIFGSVYINISYLPNVFLSKFASLELSGRDSFLYEAKLLGPAATVLQLHQKLKGDLLVIHGDLFLQAKGIHDFAEDSIRHGYSSMAVHKRALSTARSVVEVNSDFWVSALESSGTSQVMAKDSMTDDKPVFVDSGIYFFKSHDLESRTSLSGVSVFEGICKEIRNNSKLRAYYWSDVRISIDSMKSLREARTLVTEQR
jgi:NDP-sugar pyrophosphorylase family protein